MWLARQEENVEAGQVTEYEGITYATIKVRPCPQVGFVSLSCPLKAQLHLRSLYGVTGCL